MNVNEVQSPNQLSSNSSPESAANPENAAKNRELARTVKAINAGGGVGSNSELRFAIDRTTGKALIRIVDRVTDEVISQLPPESALKAAEVLKNLQPGERIA